MFPGHGIDLQPVFAAGGSVTHTASGYDFPALFLLPAARASRESAHIAGRAKLILEFAVDRAENNIEFAIFIKQPAAGGPFFRKQR